MPYTPTYAPEMPVFFGLFQTCTADKHFPTTPNDRVLPPLGDNKKLNN
jgi:hypothetical protein